MSVTIDSTNPRIIADNIRKLDDAVQTAASELPEVETTDEGKVLTVNASGKWAALDLPSSIPKDYSTTETATGLKWIDGKDIYCKVLTLPEDSETQSPIENTLDLGTIDTLIYFIGNIKSIRTALGDYIEFDLTDYYTGDHNTRTDYSSGPSQFNLRLICPNTYHFGGATIIAYYTKPDPEAEPELKKATKKKTTTKKEEE